MSPLETQVVTEGRDALSRAVRQVIQAMLPTILVIAAGSTTGIDVTAVLELAGVTALISVLKSARGFKVADSAPLVWRLGERALTAFVGSALGYLTIDGLSPATEIHWHVGLIASLGAAVASLAMFFSNPPVVVGEVVGPVVDTPILPGQD